MPYTAGYNLYTVPDHDLIHVERGDILAMTGNFKLLDNPGSSSEFYFNVFADPNWASRSTNGYFLTGPAKGVLAATHAVKAILSRPTVTRFRHMFSTTTGGLFNVTANVSNLVTSPTATGYKQIEVQVPIVGLNFTGPASGKINT